MGGHGSACADVQLGRGPVCPDNTIWRDKKKQMTIRLTAVSNIFPMTKIIVKGMIYIGYYI